MPGKWEDLYLIGRDLEDDMFADDKDDDEEDDEDLDEDDEEETW